MPNFLLPGTRQFSDVHFYWLVVVFCFLERLAPVRLVRPEQAGREENPRGSGTWGISEDVPIIQTQLGSPRRV